MQLVNILKENSNKALSYFQKQGLLQTIWYIIRREYRVARHYLQIVTQRIVSPFLRSRISIPFSFSLKDTLFSLFVLMHPLLLSIICRYAHLIRVWRKKPAIGHKPPYHILHVTCSFDLGGTQRQIMNVCEQGQSSTFHHEAVELFPESNFLYRRGITIDRDRYVNGAWPARYLGALTVNNSSRSMQIVQIYKLVRDFQALKPDVVVGWGHEVAMLTFVAAAIARVPAILFCIRTFNPSYGWTTIGPLLLKAHKSMLPHLDGVIVNSTLSQHDYATWISCPDSAVRVCPNGIERPALDFAQQRQNRETVRKQYGIPDNAMVIINVGRFSKEKGQMLLIRAFEKLISIYTGGIIYCILCGDGHTLGDVIAYVRENAIPNVVLPGRIDNIPMYLNAADIFVMPSDFEGMPNAMMEAMSYGLACISTNRSGATDIARELIEAMYIDVGADEQLVEKLMYLLSNPGERQRLGANARERIREFSTASMVKIFNDHLEDIIKSR